MAQAGPHRTRTKRPRHARWPRDRIDRHRHALHGRRVRPWTVLPEWRHIGWIPASTAGGRFHIHLATSSSIPVWLECIRAHFQCPYAPLCSPARRQLGGGGAAMTYSRQETDGRNDRGCVTFRVLAKIHASTAYPSCRGSTGEWRSVEGEGIGTRRSRSSGGGLTTSSRLGLWRKRFFRKRPARDERACARLIV